MAFNLVYNKYILKIYIEKKIYIEEIILILSIDR